MKTWFVPNEILDHAAPAEGEAERVLSSLHWAVRTLEEASPQGARRALRKAVRAYARDPTEGNAFKVEVAVAALRRQRTRSRS